MFKLAGVAVAVPRLKVAEQVPSALPVLLPGQLIVGELPAAVMVTVKLQLSPDSAVAVTVGCAFREEAIVAVIDRNGAAILVTARRREVNDRA
jgi:hypothetical protein